MMSQLQSIKLLCFDAVDSNAEVDAAPLAACSTSKQGTVSAEQVPSIEVSINGQASSLHSSQTDARHVKNGVFGRLPSFVYFADNSQALETFHCMYRGRSTKHGCSGIACEHKKICYASKLLLSCILCGSTF